MAALDDAITALQTQAAQNESVEAAAILVITGFAAQLAAAIATAAASGATPAQLAEIQAVQTGMATSAGPLGAAIATVPPATASATKKK